jgi:uncharacterized protein
MSFCYASEAQVVPNYNPYSTMTPSELEAYRQSIWDTLPAAVGWVNDFEGLYSKTEEDSLEREIEHFERATSIEIAIVTVDSNMVSREKFDDFTYRLLKKWGIGKISKSNGMVICISKDYKKLFVSCDFGIDKYMDKNEKYKIINKYFIPQFLKNDYFAGTITGLLAMQDKMFRKWSRSNKQRILN